MAVAATAVAVLALRGAAAGIAKRRLARGGATIGPMLGWMLTPLRGLAAVEKSVGRALTHGFLGEAPAGDNIFAPEEMAALTRESEAELADAERALVAKAVSFGERSVRHVLTPRRDIVAVPIDIAPADVLRVMRESGCSRIPVYRGEKDDVVGFLYVKDVLGMPLGADGIGPLVRQPYVVQAEKPVGELFREFRARKVHIALVLDEYGSLVGLVTMEDLLEELFGEMRDELDEDAEPSIRRRGSGQLPGERARVGRRAERPLEARHSALRRRGDDRRRRHRPLGRVPEVGETLQMDGFTRDGGEARRSRRRARAGRSMVVVLLAIALIALGLRAIAAGGSAALYAPLAPRTAASLEAGAAVAAVVAAGATGLASC